MYLRAGDECRGISFTPPGEGVSFRVHFGGIIAKNRPGWIHTPDGQRNATIFAGAMATAPRAQIASAAAIVTGLPINSRLTR